MIVEAASEELNIRIFVESDEGLNISIEDITPDIITEDYLIVVKNFRRTMVTETTNIDISGYARKFLIDKIIFTLISGSPTEASAGYIEGDESVMMLTDISSLEIGVPIPISVESVPGSTDNVVYFTIPGATYIIDMILIRYKL